jgi:hypothetical protein
LKRFEAHLRAGNSDARAVLLNLLEEDRVSSSDRARFHAALVTSRKRAWKDRFSETARAFPRLRPVPAADRARVSGAWFSHVKLRALQDHGYVAPVMTAARPPRKLALRRSLGITSGGLRLSSWITTHTGTDPDEIRDRLGLSYVAKGEVLYRVRFEVDRTATRVVYQPTVLDAGWYAAWRRPDAGHSEPWGMTRHLATDAPGAPELLALPHPADQRVAVYIGPIRTDPPQGFLSARRLP